MPPRDKTPVRAVARRGGVAPSSSLSREQQLSLYHGMRLTRSLEERLLALHREGRVEGECAWPLGREAESVGAAAALGQRDVISPLPDNVGALLARGVPPVDVLRHYLGRAGAPPRGRERHLFFDLDRGVIGQRLPLGEMVPVMAGVALSFLARGEDRVGLVFVDDGATRSGAFHEGISFASMHKCPLVVVVEHRAVAPSTPAGRQALARHCVDKAVGYGVPGEQVDGYDVMAVHAAVRRAVAHARTGAGVTLLELLTYRREKLGESDDQSDAPNSERDGWAETDPLECYARVLTGRERVDASELGAIDQRVRREVEQAMADAEASPVLDAKGTRLGVRAEGHA